MKLKYMIISMIVLMMFISGCSSKQNIDLEELQDDIEISNVETIQEWTFENYESDTTTEYGYAVISFDVTNDSDLMLNLLIEVVADCSIISDSGEWEQEGQKQVFFKQTYWDLQAGDAVSKNNYDDELCCIYLDPKETKHYQLTVEYDGFEQYYENFDVVFEVIEADDYDSLYIVENNEVTATIENNVITLNNETPNFIVDTRVWLATIANDEAYQYDHNVYRKYGHDVAYYIDYEEVGDFLGSHETVTSTTEMRDFWLHTEYEQMFVECEIYSTLKEHD